MGAIRLFTNYPRSWWVALMTVALALILGFGVLRNTRAFLLPGMQATIMLTILVLGGAVIFTQSLRTGRGAAGWLLWWMPVVFSILSAPLAIMVPGLLGPRLAGGVQAWFLLSFSWLAMLWVPLAWFFVVLPWQLLFHAVGALRRRKGGRAVGHLAWAAAIGGAFLALTLAYVAVTDQSIGSGPGLLLELPKVYHGLGSILEPLLLVGPVVLGVIAVLAFIIAGIRIGRTGLATTFTDAVPVLKRNKNRPEPSDGRSGLGFSPLRLWRGMPGAVLLMVTTIVFTASAAILGYSSSFLYPSLLYLGFYVGEFAWAVVLVVLAGINLATVLAARNAQAFWLMAWLAILVTLTLNVWITAVSPSFGGLDGLGIAFIALLMVVLSCVSWLFLVIPVQLTAASLWLLLTGRGAGALGGLVLGLGLLSGGGAIISGSLAVRTTGSGGQDQNAAAIIAALLGIEGDYYIESDVLLWAARILILMMTALALLARFAAGGKGQLQGVLNRAAGLDHLGGTGPDPDSGPPGPGPYGGPPGPNPYGGPPGPHP